MDEDLFDSEDFSTGGGLTDQEAVGLAGGTQTIASSPGLQGLQGYMQMLGMMPQQQSVAPATQPAVAPAVAPMAAQSGALPAGSMNPLLGLGITGQRAQLQPGLGAFGASAMPVNYAPPAPVNIKPGGGGSGGGMGGMGSMLGGFL